MDRPVPHRYGPRLPMARHILVLLSSSALAMAQDWLPRSAPGPAAGAWALVRDTTRYELLLVGGPQVTANLTTWTMPNRSWVAQTPSVAPPKPSTRKCT